MTRRIKKFGERKGGIMQIEKGLINDRLRVSKIPESFALQLFIILL